MIRRNSSKINPSVVENPVIAEHITAAEGIHVDKPVTNLNHVVNSLNFDITNDNTYELRKPLTLQSCGYYKNILLHTKEHFLKFLDTTDAVIKDINDVSYDVYFKYTDLTGKTHYVSVDFTSLGNFIDFSNVKYTYSPNSTILYNVKVNLLNLKNNYNIILYDNTLYDNATASNVYRLLSVYLDTEYLINGKACWVVELINPELNSFTGDATSATNFNPNLLLDNPYAIRDLYNYGGNSVTQILAYTTTGGELSSEHFVVEEDFEMAFSNLSGVFRVEYDTVTKTIYAYTRVHILGYFPKLLNPNSIMDHLKTIDNSQDISLSIHYSTFFVSSGASNSINVGFKQYIPAGTLIFKIPIEEVPTYAQIYINLKSYPIYFINSKYTFEEFYNAPHLKFERSGTYACTINNLNSTPTYSDSRSYGFDVVFAEDSFKLRKLEGYYPDITHILFSNTELDEVSSDMFVPFINENLTFDVGYTFKKHVYLGYYNVDLPDVNISTVAELTERVTNPIYNIGTSFNVNYSSQVLLKAFLTTQKYNDKYYCTWEMSKDEGVTWNVAPEFLEAFKNDIVEIPILDETVSNETLDSPDTYTKRLATVSFSKIQSNKDNILERPDILQIGANGFQYKYRFSIYKYTTSSEKFSFKSSLMYGVYTPMLEVNGFYNTSVSTLSTLGSLNLNTSNKFYVRTSLVFDKVRFFISKHETYNPQSDEYSDLGIESDISFGENRYVAFTLPTLNTDNSATHYCKIALCNDSDNIIEILNLRIYAPITLDASSTDNALITFIPNLECSVSKEDTSFIFRYFVEGSNNSSTAVDETYSDVLYDESFNNRNFSVGGGDDSDYSVGRSYLFTYSVSGTIYNHTNIPQIFKISETALSSKYDSATPNTVASQMALNNPSREPGISGVSSKGTLTVGDTIYNFNVEYTIVDGFFKTTTLRNVSNLEFVIKSNSSITFKYTYNFVRSTSTTQYLHGKAILRRGIVPLVIQTINNTNITVVNSTFSEESNVGVGSGIVPYFEVDNRFIKPEEYNGTETINDINLPVTYNFPTITHVFFNQDNVFDDSNTPKNAYLVSQKEYTFTLTDSERAVLSPKPTSIYDKNMLYYNNQLIFYGSNDIYVSDTNSYILPMYNTIDVYGGAVTKILPWRNYLVIFTTTSVYLASYDVESGYYTTKLVSTNIGLSEQDAETAVDVLNGIVFKSGNKVYRLVPSAYAATDSILNLTCISTPIEGLLNNTLIYGNCFAFSTNEAYCLFIPHEEHTMCYKYNFLKKVWTIHKYPIRLTDYSIIDVDNILLDAVDDSYKYWEFDGDDLNNGKLWFDSDDISEYDLSDVEYGDLINTEYTTPIDFFIDFGQKSSRYSDNKQFIGSKIILGTLSEKDTFPFEINISTDGMSRDIHIDGTTDSAMWKNSLEQIGTLSTSFTDDSTESTGILRQMVLKYSGRGKTIRHILNGKSVRKFKFYSLDYKYRNLPNK